MTSGDSSPPIAASIASSRYRNPSSRRPEADQRNGLNVRPEREQIAVSGALSNRGRLARNLRHEHVLAGRFVPQCERQEQVAALRAVPFLALDQALRPPEPTARPGHVTQHRQVDAEMHGRAHRAARLTGADVRMMSTLERREELVDPTEHVRGDRQRFQILGREAVGLVRRGQRLVRHRPHILRKRPLAALDVSGPTHENPASAPCLHPSMAIQAG